MSPSQTTQGQDGVMTLLRKQLRSLVLMFPQFHSHDSRERCLGPRCTCIAYTESRLLALGLSECYPPKEARNERGSSAEQGRPSPSSPHSSDFFRSCSLHPSVPILAPMTVLHPSHPLLHLSSRSPIASLPLPLPVPVCSMTRSTEPELLPTSILPTTAAPVTRYPEVSSFQGHFTSQMQLHPSRSLAAYDRAYELFFFRQSAANIYICIPTRIS